MVSSICRLLIQAFSLIGLCGLVLAAAGTTGRQTHPPIAVHFHLDHSGFVTLVVENESGVRVRNLVSETYFPAGDQVAWWDGLDDLERDINSAEHAVYNVPGRMVKPGTYKVRGLYRQQIDLKYEFAIYNHGQPPWMTRNTSSEWLTTHTPPEAVCFIPAGLIPVHGNRDIGSPGQVLIGSGIAEGGSGLAWVDLDGAKLHGQMWVGGVWTGAQQFARDLGPRAVPGVYAYVASSWNGELRLQKLVSYKHPELKGPNSNRLGNGEDQAVLNSTWRYPKPDLESLGGVAAYDGLLIVSLPKMDQLLLVDAARARVIGTYPISKPGGIFADRSGNLFVISEKKLLKMALRRAKEAGSEALGSPHVIVGEGLEDPQQITMDNEENLYISDWGISNQVKIFSPQGNPLGSIGTAGVPTPGPYNPKLMHHPKGITIDSQNRLWVAEEDFQPKRVSIWNLDGRLLRAFYGPVTYGGGGVLDPRDKALFYLDGMTFRLDWKTGKSDLIDIYHRPRDNERDLVPTTTGNPTNPPFRESGVHAQFSAGENPDFPVYVSGRRYFTNAYNSDPTTGAPVVGIWISKEGVAVPVAAFGKADSRQLFLSAAFRSHVPMPTNSQVDSVKPLDLSGYTFAWSDLNGNGIAEPDEITMVPGSTHAVTVSANLQLTTDTAMTYKPVAFTTTGAPVYDLSKGKTLCPETQRPTSTGGGQVLVTEDNRAVLTTGPKPFASQSVAGAEHGAATWSYPSLWPGLHASHIAPVPEFQGELIGTTRLLGPSFRIHKLQGVELWAINGNKGTIYLFTTDGLFVATLFTDSRFPSSSWAGRSNTIRGMSVTGLTAGEENFWPSITQTEDGAIYVVTNYPAIIRVDGLDSIRRLSSSTIHVTPGLLEEATAYFKSLELSRQHRSAQVSDTLTIPVQASPLTLSGDLSTWDSKFFVTIDERSKLIGDWGRTKLRTSASIRVAGNRLFVAFRTGDPRAPENSGASFQHLFSTGGGLDLMLATDPRSNPQRKSAAAGDIRLLVSLVKGKPVAVMYRPVSTTGPKNNALFESPRGTLRIDDVEDVSEYVQFEKGSVNASAGDFEFSIPLNVLRLNPRPGTELRGDIGLLRGDGARTIQRVYWSNKATGLVSDIPSEAELTPELWGKIRFVDSPDSRK